MGELALDGRIRPVGGVLVAAEGARRAGLDRILCAAETAPEAAWPASTRSRSATSPMPSPTSAASSRPPRSSLPNGDRRPNRPISPTSAARSALDARSSWPRRALTTSCSQARRERGRRCSRRRLPSILPPLTARRRSR